MLKLCQLVATIASKKKRAAEAITHAYHLIQKGGLLDGLVRVYQPKDEDGDRLPGETKLVQVTIGRLLDDVIPAMCEMMDAIRTQDEANCSAVADVVVDGVALLQSVPVTHLLFLEKQLTDLGTFIGKLPTLDPAQTWTYDAVSDMYASDRVESTRTKKVPKAFVKYEATKEHAAQVDVFSEDVLVGYWRQTNHSGAIPQREKSDMLERVRKLREAVTSAREDANSRQVVGHEEGRKVLGYVFGSRSRNSAA